MAQKIAWFHPTGHYLQTFVHEFGHSAHFKNLYSRGNAYSMVELRNAQIPTSFGRFLAKFNLGRYSATNMNEFMAERITKDVCKNLDRNDGFVGNVRDLDYSDIFSRKWSYRYSSPQAYLDYYTQQVWNGDVTEAKNALNQMERYLKEIELAERPVITTVYAEPKDERCLVEKVFDLFSGGRKDEVTKFLDRRNRIHMK